MAIPTYYDWTNRSKQAVQLPISKTNLAPFNYPHSSWLASNNAGSAPSTAVVPTSATAGALNRFTGRTTNSLQAWVGHTRLSQAVTTRSSGVVYLIDRLSHQGGLSGLLNTTQTTNLPTAALTRYTSGAGVCCALQIYTGVGATAVNASVSYTNQSGTSGRTSPGTQIGSTSFSAANRLLICPLQDGDSGVRSVESVTLDASTLTAGNFGVLLFRVLGAFPLSNGMTPCTDFSDGMTGGVFSEEILSDACLDLMVVHESSSASLVGFMELVQA